MIWQLIHRTCPIVHGLSASKNGVRDKRPAARILNNPRMQTIERATEDLLCAVGDPLGAVRHVGPRHPEFNGALILRAATGVIAKVPSALPSIRHALRQIDRETASAATLAHAEAADAWAGGDPVLAAERYAAIVADSPSDLLALRLAQSCYFFLGWHDRFAAICDAVLHDWPGSADGLQYALAMTAFAHAESDDTEYAEFIGRRALEFKDSCPMSVHAVAHAYAESGRHREGALWMLEQHAHWRTESRMRTHNAWHLAMFELEGGGRGDALEVLDEWLMPAIDESVLDACDATALLWRLDLGGIDAGTRWRRLSDAFERTAPGFWPYVDLHAGFAHWLADQGLRARRLETAVADYARGHTHAALRARRITLPGLAAFAAIADGRIADALPMLARLKPLLAEAGGSKAQLELFYGLSDEFARAVESVRRRRHVAGGRPTARLNARENAASES